ncbi:MAG: YeeE/YedE thiosulfate transporter family protein [Burkholderiaceae bacterium]
MNLELTHPLFWFAALCVATMGYAIQRGATCTVAAVDEILTKRTTRRLSAFLEASLWVAGILALAQVFGLLARPPQGYALTQWTVIGGALLGLGAFINGACVFGAIARLGSGQWVYVLTPVGFYLGCLSSPWLFGTPAQPRLDDVSVVLDNSVWVAALFLAYVAWRLTRSIGATRPASAPRRFNALRSLAQRVWTPHAATTVIGVTFALMLLTAGVWAYTDVLVQLARGVAQNLWLGSALLLALLFGAMFGGYTAGRWKNTPPTATDVFRCLAGGALMGWGSLLIPGSNDGLILVGMPMLWPYAWVAFATMCATIALAQAWQRHAFKPAQLSER